MESQRIAIVGYGSAGQASAVLLQHTEVLMDGIVAYANAAHQRALYSSLALFVLDALLLLLGYVLVARRVLHLDMVRVLKGRD